MSRLLILDFDGTMTDAEREGAPYREGYLDDLAILTGRSGDEIRALAARFEAVIAADQGSFGWDFAGRIVAPANVDPYLRIMPVARMIFDECGVFPDAASRSRLLDGILYKYNYGKTATAFRPGAAEALARLAPGSGVETFVVTNSHTTPVQAKIERLGQESGIDLAWLRDRVCGSARKYVIDDGFEGVPGDLLVDGLGRPILLRRRHYFEVLDRLRIEAGAEWADALVVGDIFELDLCLPLQLGARVGLVLSPFTPDYERRYLGSHPRGHLLESLADLPALALSPAR